MGMRAFVIGVSVVTVALAAMMISGTGGPGDSRTAPPGGVVLSAVPGCVPDVRELAQPWRRDDLERALIGKTTYEVCFKLGSPRSSNKSGSSEYWYYGGVSLDDRSGKPDNQIQVVFEDGRVERVNF